MDEIGSIKNTINIRDIKSPFIIINIFSFLSEKQKLNMVMYNQQFQKLLLVDIKNYIKMSGKFKIGGKNGKGKVYLIDSNNFIFKGEYLNRKEIGNYCKNKLIFKRDYINAKKKWKRKRIL